VFAAWRAQGKRVLVRYHPEDLSRVYASVNGKDYVEAPYADLRRPRISLAEQRAVSKMLRAQGERVLTEERLFAAIEAQRDIVRRALADTRRVRREEPKGRGQGRGVKRRSTRVAGAAWKPLPEPPSDEVDYSRPAPPYPVELW
jgi:putative transposase